VAKPFEFFDHTADIGVHIHSRTLEELFRNAAAALFDALGTLQTSEIRSQKLMESHAESLEDLLHDWLADLLYEVEAHHILYDEFDISRVDSRGMKAILRGGQIDFARSQTNEEIKAVTYHQLCVESLPDGGWRATVIFDV
jgi:SHS2 domain-containing protein